jgi:hypothetical protein
LFVLATAEYLNVIYHIVGTSNNAKDPVTVIYFQDTMDGIGEKRQAGHYQSLEPIPNKAVPCCDIRSNADDDNDEIVHGASEVRND